jgi:hypothetical protein
MAHPSISKKEQHKSKPLLSFSLNSNSTKIQHIIKYLTNPNIMRTTKV